VFGLRADGQAHASDTGTLIPGDLDIFPANGVVDGFGAIGPVLAHDDFLPHMRDPAGTSPKPEQAGKFSS